MSSVIMEERFFIYLVPWLFALTLQNSRSVAVLSF